jgi:hypothetical protein
MSRLVECLQHLPSFIALVDNIAARLAEVRCVVCVVGCTFDPDLIVQAAANHFVLRDRYPFVVDASRAGTPARLLGEALGFDVEAILCGARITDVGGGVISVSNLDALAPEEQDLWAALVDRWGRRQQMARSAGEALLPSILLATTGRTLRKLPGEQVDVSVLGAVGTLTELELGLAVRLARDAADDWVTATWRENILPAVAGPDLEIADACWMPCIGSIADVTTACREIGVSRGWTAPAVAKALSALETPRAANVNSLSQLAAALRSAWTMGAVAFTPENGFEPSVAAYALLERQVEIERRVWRGQARLVLPLVDRIRFELCRALDDRLPSGWQLSPPPKDEDEFEEVRRDPLMCQPGHLVRLLWRTLTIPQRQREQFQRLAVRCRDVRNTIAHYRPISFGEFRELLLATREAGLQVGIQSVR